MTNSITFKYGFVVRPASEPQRIKECEGWAETRIGSCAVVTHPDLEVAQYQTKTGKALVLGEVFIIGSGTIAEVIRKFRVTNDGLLVGPTERLSGRFAIILEDGSKQVIFHDPAGSQEICYSTAQPGTASSHELLCAKQAEAPVSKEVADLIAGKFFRKRLVKYFPGDITRYEHVYRLIPNNGLHLSDASTT